MKKKSLVNFLLVLMLIIGLSLLLYPSFSNYWNSFTQTKVISNYSDVVAHMDSEAYQLAYENAREFNRKLQSRSNQYVLSEELQAEYQTQLDITGAGIMGYIEIPSINVMLPIYHGTGESVLQVAVGHLEWTSLPTGGESTHCVLSGHRGLPSARLFTDLDELVEGDYFILHILDETLTYEVDQIRIVEPQETSDLLPQAGKDLCTLVTCTPYGVNSHRLLVRGHRVDNLEEAQEVRVTADAMIVEKMVVVPFVLIPILVLMLIGLLIFIPKKKNRRNEK